MPATAAILLPDLRPGGAERLHIHLAQAWLQRGIAVDFVLQQARGELLAHIPPDARIIDLSAPRVRRAAWPLRNYLREERPDGLLAAMWPLTVIGPLAAQLAAFKGRLVVSEHEPISLSYAARGRLHNSLMAVSMHASYRLADARVGVSGGVADDMARLSGMDRIHFNVIHNPAATGQVCSTAYVMPSGLEGRSGPILLAVGTLKSVKRHDLMIRAFARLSHPDATLCILGEGPERAALESLITSLGLKDRVLLAGYQPDPAPWYAHADLFLLSSDYEGFGNVIVEALEHGLPVVSTNCPSGPREILEDGKYGTLVSVGNVGALAQAMDEALSREHDRVKLQRRAQDFSVEKAADAYLDLLLPGWRNKLVSAAGAI